MSRGRIDFGLAALREQINADTLATTMGARDQRRIADQQIAAGQQRMQQSQQLFNLLFGSGGGTGFFQDVFTPAFQGLTGAAEGAIGNIGSGGQFGQPGGPDVPLGSVPGVPTPGGNIGNFLLGREQQALGLAQQFGESQRSRINRDFDASVGSAMARLEAGGLGSSSLTPAALSQQEEARQQSLLGLEDALLGQQLGIIQGTTGGVAEAGAQDKQIASGLIGSLLGGIF